MNDEKDYINKLLTGAFNVSLANNLNLIGTAEFLLVMFYDNFEYCKKLEVNYKEFQDKYNDIIGCNCNIENIKGLFDDFDDKESDTSIIKTPALINVISHNDFLEDIIIEIISDDNCGSRILKEINHCFDLFYLKEADDIPEYFLDLNKQEYITNPAIGRDIIIEDIEKTLLKMNKPNILLIGEPGVGKTAIVEGLAYKIQKGMVNDKLKKYRILSCSTASLVAGTKYRGEFEEKINNICNFFKNHKEYILFLDEMHTTLNAGGAEGAINMANILKPYLARGDIKVIGCTTTQEKSTIEKDGAYNRRFTKIFVEENSLNETRRILENSLEKFNNFYQITADKKLMGDVITEAKDLNGNFPDKAIDLLENVYADTVWNGDNSFNKKDIKRVAEILKDRQEQFV